MRNALFKCPRMQTVEAIISVCGTQNLNTKKTPFDLLNTTFFLDKKKRNELFVKEKKMHVILKCCKHLIESILTL